MSCSDIWRESINIRKRYNLCPVCQQRKASKCCLSDECEISANYNFPEYDWPRYCSRHKVDGMVDYLRNYVNVSQCDGKCEDAQHVGGGSYICPHNSLDALYPHISREWNIKKNIGLGPNTIGPGSRKRVYWICKNGHSFITTVANRVRRNNNCPECR
tara:strand:- start:287 stop:760 length:474 start_codon:yes stop_codon:yes gene_type:complete